MTKSNRFIVYFLCSGLIAAYHSQCLADQQYEDDTEIAATVERVQSRQPCTYGQKVNEKALRSLSNLEIGMMEIPKSVINVTNESNIFYGFTGGVIKGFINTMGRIGTGIADLVSLPIPTKPIANPINVWDDFDADTQYNPVFRTDECPDDDTVIATPVAQEVKPRPAVIVPARQVLNEDYNQQTNKKLDTVFKKQMMK